MPPSHRLTLPFLALLGIAVLDVPDAKALSCALPPSGENVFLEIESVTEDGVEVMDDAYSPVTAYLHGTENNVRLWFISENSESWWQDFE